MHGAIFALSLIFLSQSSILVRFAEAPSLAICFWRLVITVVLLFPLAYRHLKRDTFRALTRHDWLQFALSGAMLFLHFYFFFRSVHETTIANTMILFSINPITTAIGAYYFFRERVTLHLVLACTLGIAGIAVIFEGSVASHSAGLSGDIWSVLSATCFSGYILSGKHIRRRLPNTVFTMGIYLQTALYALIAMLLLGTPFHGYSTATWWAFLALAIFPTLLGHAIFTYSLNYMNVNFMSCAKLVEPVLSAIVANWLFHEPLTPLAAIGFLLTSGSVIVLYWEAIKNGLKRGLARSSSN